MPPPEYGVALVAQRLSQPCLFHQEFQFRQFGVIVTRRCDRPQSAQAEESRSRFTEVGLDTV